MKKNLILILFFTSVNLFAQQKLFQYLSGIDAKRTMQLDFFCTAGRLLMMYLFLTPEGE